MKHDLTKSEATAAQTPDIVSTAFGSKEQSETAAF